MYCLIFIILAPSVSHLPNLINNLTDVNLRTIFKSNIFLFKIKNSMGLKEKEKSKNLLNQNTFNFFSLFNPLQ